jgi:anaerobic selenocysteine-containing dehydrogenase
VLLELLARVDPERAKVVGCGDAAAIREDIARAVPAYDGIQRLYTKGDQLQWGGARLCERDGAPHFELPDGRAHAAVIPLEASLFDPPEAPLPDDRFRISTRRGKQFNSMIWDDRDSLTGAARDDVLISAEDVARLGLREGQRVRLRSDVGEMEAHVRTAPILARNLQVHWPEGNVLIRRGRVDPRCGEPDYNAVVEVIAL